MSLSSTAHRRCAYVICAAGTGWRCCPRIA